MSKARKDVIQGDVDIKRTSGEEERERERGDKRADGWKGTYTRERR
jgi:hypothetical protein